MRGLPLFPDMYPQILHGLPAMPVFHMRGGTSTGIVLWDAHLPQEVSLREELVRHLMGVPQEGTTPRNRQTTGLGRGAPTSNKVFLMKHHQGADADFDSTLAQLAADHARIDWGVNCGNMSAALPLYLLQTGLAEPATPETQLRIWNTNTRKLTDMRMPTPFEMATIPGVPGRFPSVELVLRDPVGARTGSLFPTGNRQDCFDDVPVSCVDVAVPMVIVRATDLGYTARESVASLQADPGLMARLRSIWVQAGLRMGLKTAAGAPMTEAELAQSETVPKICMVGPGDGDSDIHVRYFTPQAPHSSMAVTGGCCLAVAALLGGTVAFETVSQSQRSRTGASSMTAQIGYEPVVVRIGNPAGILQATVSGYESGSEVTIPWVSYQRSAQVLLQGLAPIYQASDALMLFFESRHAQALSGRH